MMQEFAQQVEETARAVVDEIHTAMPGTVILFDPESCTATVKPNGKYMTADGKRLDYPQITDVPVVFPFCQTAEVGIAFPVQKDDSCMIIISEMELDEWRTGAESEGSLRFDLTSAICVPGLLKCGMDIISKACQNNAVVVVAGDTKMTISGDGVAISGDLKVNGNIYSTRTITP